MTLSALGKTMNNLAATYTSLGRHQEALVMREKTLEFQRRVLPENHPDMGIACVNLGACYANFGDMHRALPLAREALRIFQATLPPLHPDVKYAQQLVRHCEVDTARRL